MAVDPTGFGLEMAGAAVDGVDVIPHPSVEEAPKQFCILMEDHLMVKVHLEAKHADVITLAEPDLIAENHAILESIEDERVVKEICPRGNNNVVILYFLIHDKCLLFMLELY